MDTATELMPPPGDVDTRKDKKKNKKKEKRKEKRQQQAVERKLTDEKLQYDPVYRAQLDYEERLEVIIYAMTIK